MRETVAPNRVLAGDRVSRVSWLPGSDRVSRVSWLPGSDRLLGECSCGARAEGGDPIGMWQWLLAHPDHPAAVTEPDVDVTAHVPPPHRVLHPAQAAGPRTPLR